MPLPLCRPHTSVTSNIVYRQAHVDECACWIRMRLHVVPVTWGTEQRGKIKFFLLNKKNWAVLPLTQPRHILWKLAHYTAAFLSIESASLLEIHVEQTVKSQQSGGCTSKSWSSSTNAGQNYERKARQVHVWRSLLVVLAVDEVWKRRGSMFEGFLLAPLHKKNNKKTFVCGFPQTVYKL